MIASAVFDSDKAGVATKTGIERAQIIVASSAALGASFNQEAAA
jgi:hypothetical protein